MNRKFLAVAAVSMASAYSAPLAAQHALEWKPKTTVIGDWVYGCSDAEKSYCEAMALPPDSTSPGTYLPMKINRYKNDPGYLDFPGFDYIAAGDLKISVDEKSVRSNLKFPNTYGDPPGFEGDKALNALRPAILNGAKMSVRDSAGELIGYVSLKGSTAVLAKLDQEQKLEGYTTAFVKRGKKKHSPTLMMPMAADYNDRRIGQSAISRGDIADFAATVKCDNGQETGTKHSAFGYGGNGAKDKSLLFIDCGTEGINSVSKAFLGTKIISTGKWSFEPATYYDYATDKDIAMSLLYNVELMAYGKFSSSRYLTSKDCGERFEFDKTYGEKKSLFRISNNYEMPVCRGVKDWIRVN